MSICLAQSKKSKWHVWNSATGDTLCGLNLDYPDLKDRSGAGLSVKDITQPIHDGSFCKHCLRRLRIFVRNINRLERGEL